MTSLRSELCTSISSGSVSKTVLNTVQKRRLFNIAALLRRKFSPSPPNRKSAVSSLTPLAISEDIDILNNSK